jgi:hypothetical protein
VFALVGIRDGESASASLVEDEQQDIKRTTAAAATQENHAGSQAQKRYWAALDQGSVGLGPFCAPFLRAGVGSGRVSALLIFGGIARELRSR